MVVLTESQSVLRVVVYNACFVPAIMACREISTCHGKLDLNAYHICNSPGRICKFICIQVCMIL